MRSLILLIAILIFLLAAVYIVNGYDYMRASFFMIGTFIVSSMIALLNINEWHLSFSLFACFLISTLLIAFAAGDALGGQYRVVFRFGGKETKPKTVKFVHVPRWISLLVCAFMGAVGVFYYRHIMRISILAGNRRGMARMLVYARFAITNINIDSSVGTALGHGIIISECLGYLYLFIILFNFINGHKNDPLYFVPCAIYILHIALSTARIGFITFVCAGIILTTVMFYQKNRRNRYFRINTMIYVLAGFFFVLLGFRMLGYLTGKSSVRELWGDLSVYIGGSIPAFSYYLGHRPAPNDLFGKETLFNIYKMARGVGISNIPVYSSSLPFIKEHYFSTNIYTAFRRLIQDYGYAPTYIIMFLEGIFYGSWTNRVKKNGYLGVETVIFAYMFYPVVYTFIDEQFILSFTAIRLIYHLVYFVVLYRILIGARIKIG